jgi:hypothetical protein
MIGLDTTVLLTHEIKEAAGHEGLRAYIATACRSGNVLFAISPQVLQEFVHAATDPRRFKMPLTMDQALERSRFLQRSFNAIPVDALGSRHGPGLKNSASTANAFSTPTSPLPTTSAASSDSPPQTQWISRCSEFLNSKIGPSNLHKIANESFIIFPQSILFTPMTIRS